MKPIYDDGENLDEEVDPLAADVSAPDVSDEFTDAPPMVQAAPVDANYVPPELKFDTSSPRQPPPDNRLQMALDADKKRQAQSDVRAYLLAAGRREAPHLQNLGSPDQQAVHGMLAQEAAARPKSVDPLAREKMALEVAKMHKELGKPVDQTDADLKRAQTAKAYWDIVRPKEQKSGAPSGADARIPDSARPVIEAKIGPLSPDATWREAGIVAAQVSASENRAQSGSQFAQALLERQKQEKDSETRRQQGMEIPGWKRDPSVRAEEAEVNKLRDAAGEGDAIKEDLSRLEGLISKTGVVPTPGSREAVEMNGYLKDLQLKLKGQAVYQLGVLSGPDMAILEKVTGDPTALNFQNVFGGKDAALTQLRGIRERTEMGLRTRFGSRGYTRGAAKGGKVLVRRGDEVLRIDPSDVEAASVDGYEVQP